MAVAPKNILKMHPLKKRRSPVVMKDPAFKAPIVQASSLNKVRNSNTFKWRA